jgi:asparagine synthase (glutamine-hydrolysing)
LQIAIAQRTADALGLQLVTIRMDEKLIADDFEDAVWHCEHHNPDFNYVGKFALSKAVRANGIKVVLTGKSLPFL